MATASLGDRILNSFNDLHYGTFWGLPSRIFYMFVGFAPLILLIVRKTPSPRGRGCKRG
ncbi:PepSY-associated TM helix domain-containing protein [Nostoc sp. UHCC 0926]|uniref:PepSY domain-containing protein n=1 Tax=unclassified Nostoc TaxID=2593658 RepID=UPI00235F13F2|nr:PepSY-associated TM helix domain-containing protein [Nostoc sp. UHCC 0926]WDD34024.1 PepSY-associated TM helix domain-containing protein [Nostoc sp. UHCC 0926]